MTPTQTHAQINQYEQREGDGVQTYTGTLTDDNPLLIYLKQIKRGDTIYIYTEGAGVVNNFMVLVDVGFEEYFAGQESDGVSFMTLTYTSEEPTRDYVLALVSDSVGGDFSMTVGINTQVVDDGNAGQQGFFDDLVPPTEVDCSTNTQATRPTYDTRVWIIQSPNFIIHYTLEGVDATTTFYVTQLQTALEASLSTQLNILGWAMPPRDCGEGFDERFDVYVKHIDRDAIGIAYADRLVGDNPNTPASEIKAAYGYLVIENDMEFLSSEDGIRLMQVVAAHEVHHNIQFGYDNNEPFFGFYEAGAVWIEMLVYPDYTTASDFAELVLDQPDVCLGNMLAGGGVRIYGEWLWIDSLAQDHGLDSYQRIWESLATSDGMLAFYNGLAQIGTTPEEAMKRVAIRYLLRNFTLGDQLITPYIEATASQLGDVQPRRDGVQQLSSDFVRVDSNVRGITSFEIKPPTLRLAIVGIDEAGQAQVFDIGAFGTVDLTPFEHVYTIVLNPNQHVDTTNCQYTDWTLRLSDGTGNATAMPTRDVWDTRLFEVAR